MGLRLISEYKGGWHPRQVPFSIEIHDKDSISVGDPWFRTDADGAVIYWGGEYEDLVPSICPAHCRFNMFLEEQAHYFFLEDLKQAQEDRFTVIVRQGPDKIFIGNIVTDGLQKEDSNHPTPKLRIYASDGLEKFKTITYDDGAGNLYDGNNWEPATTHIQRVLNLWDAKSFMGSADGIYITSDIYEANMVGTSDNFSQTMINNQVFLNRTDNGISAKNCHEVLTILCHILDVRLIQLNGKFIFESLNVRCESNTFKRWWYTVGMSLNYAITWDSDDVIQVNYPVHLGRWPDLRIRPGIETYPPPVRFVSVSYEHGTGLDYLHGKLFNFFGEIGQVFANVGVAAVPDDVTRLKFLGTIEILPKWDIGTDPQRYRIIFRFLIKIGDQYYERKTLTGVPPFLVGAYEKERWTTDVPDNSGLGEYAWLYPGPFTQDRDDQRRIPLHFEILSLPIPEVLDGEDVTIGLRYDLYNQDSGLETEAPFTIQIQLEDGQVLIVDQENSKVEKSKITYKQTNAINNSFEIERTIITSDGPNNSAPNRLKVRPTGSSDEIDASSWSSTRYFSKHHANLLALEILHRRSEPRTILEGDIYTARSLLNNFVYCGNTLIFLAGEYNTGKTIVSGKWLFRKTLSVKSTVEDVVQFSQDTGGKQTLDSPIIPPPPPPHIQFLNGPLTEITPDIEIPSLAGLTDLQIWERIKPIKNGLGRRITTDPKNDGWKWNNTTKKIIPDELIRPNDWVKIEYDRSLLYEEP